MIYIDTPRVWSQKYGLSCHLFSDLPGPEGSAELEVFRKRIGHRRSWLQKAGTAEEHYDVMRSRIEVARKAGAIEVSSKEWVEIVQAKRRAMGG